MKFDRVSYAIDSKNFEAKITLHFVDTDPSMPQMDNMVSRTVTWTLDEWSDFIALVKKTAGF